jgi:uncharacterized membrane protein YedE/YeeE
LRNDGLAQRFITGLRLTFRLARGEDRFDMTSFTPISAAIGGAVIGFSAALLLLLDGRIAGISGIVGGLGHARSDDWAWRIAFIVGLVAGPMLLQVAGGDIPAIALPSSGLLALGGLLVGFGTRLGGGCTSGHGVCGLARLSRRSMIATGLFMLAAAITVFATRHIVWA